MSRSDTVLSGKRRSKLERVLGVAGELFAGADFPSVCMDEIARRAGVGKGTLYNLFDSKEDLYFSIIRSRLAELLDVLERSHDGRNDTLRNLRSLILHLHRFMSKHPHFYLLWKREESSLARAERLGILELDRRISRLVSTILRRGAEEGIVRPGLNRDLVVRLILGMVDGLCKTSAAVYRREEVLDQLLEVLVRGIGVEGVPAGVMDDEYRHRREPIDE